jgi:transposase
MTSWRSREELVQQIVTLARDGLSRRAITRATGVSRNTVRAVLAAHQRGRTEEHAALRPRPARAPRASMLDRFKPRIAELMTQYPHITAQRVFESLREEGFDGGYNTVKKFVRAARPKSKPQPSRSTPVYGPGEMAESDGSPYTITFTDGQRMRVEALSYVLVHSKRKAFALFASNDLHALMDGHEQAFDRFKGCAAQCKYDSQKPVVLQAHGPRALRRRARPSRRASASSLRYGASTSTAKRGAARLPSSRTSRRRTLASSRRFPSRLASAARRPASRMLSSSCSGWPRAPSTSTTWSLSERWARSPSGAVT